MLRRSFLRTSAVALSLAVFSLAGVDRGTAEELKMGDYGQAPEFTGINAWLNSPPLTMESLKGKVVLVDFWTYSCINCLRTLPYVTKWYDTYKDKGFVVVGVHTPEFAFEKVTRNIETAAKRFSVKYPIAQDNDYVTWKAYGTQYWPSSYLVDRTGKIVIKHFGEGQYDEMENAIRTLLAVKEPMVKEPEQANLNKVGSPEMYFGLSRLEHMRSNERPLSSESVYTAPAKQPLNTYALQGSWMLQEETATLKKDDGEISLRFNSGKVHMVASSPDPVTLSITVDGKPQSPITVSESRLYTLFDSAEYKEHEIKIRIPKAGFMAYTFTFG